MNPFRKSVPPFFQVFSGLLLLLAAAVILLHPNPVRANIATDGTVGPMQTLTGPDFIIPQDLGALRGQNLFHSFRTFGIDSGQSATFTGENSIANVISRVTGGEASHINGLLRSTIGQADFYFINPSGVVFGPQAEVDVPAAFHVSTANELKFADGSSFSATDTGSSTLTQAAPEAFGFLGGQAGNIEINGSRFDFGANRTVSLSGGDITIQRGLDADGEAVTPILQTEAGHIYLTAVGDRAATVYSDGRETLGTGGDITMDSARVDVSGDGGGQISIQAENVSLGNSSVVASDNTGAKAAEGDLTIHAEGQLQITGGSRIQSNVLDSGDSGNVTITAGQMIADGGGSEYATGVSSDASTGSEGKAGEVTITVSGLLEVLNGGQIRSDTFSKGDAGSVTINAEQMIIDGQGGEYFTGVSSSAYPGSEGKADEVTITVSGLLEVLNGGDIRSSTWSKGDAGRVTVNAGQMTIDRQGGRRTDVSSDAEPGSEGKAGEVTITVSGLLEVLNGGAIGSVTWSKGEPGRVTVNAGQMTIDRQGSASFTGVLSVDGPGSEGKAGEVTITVSGLLEVLNGGAIRSSTFSKGDAGSVTVNAGQMTIDGQGGEGFAGVASNAESGSEGKAGEVTITVSGLLEVLNGGQICSDTWSEGDAGRVTVNAGQMTIDRQGGRFTAVSSDAYPGSEGKAGEVTITVSGLLEVLNGGAIGSVTWSKGEPGRVTVNAGQMTIDRQGSASLTGVLSVAGPGSEGKAGEVTITVSGLLEVLNGGKVRSDNFSKGGAGSVTINAGQMTIDGQGGEGFTGVSSDAVPGSEGKAGEVTITVSGLLEVLNGGQIRSSIFSKGGAGSVTINAGQMTIDGQGGEGFTGVSSGAEPGSEGKAGEVTITVSGLLEVLNGGAIGSATFSKGDAGSVTINAGQMTIDRQGGEGFTGVSSDAYPSSEGNAGEVTITVSGLLEVLNGGQICSSTYSKGDAGSVTIYAGQMTIDGQESEYVNGVSSDANRGSEGNAGEVMITVSGLLEVLNGGAISSATWSKGDAGSVTITAVQMTIDRQGGEYFTGVSSDAASVSEGNAGEVTITVSGLLEVLNGGQIRSATWSKGDAGSVTITAEQITIDRQGGEYFTGVSSDAASVSEGNAGEVTVTVSGLLEVLNGGAISSSTFSTGDAGNVTIKAEKLIVDIGRIQSRADSSSSGYVGNVIINADSITLQNDSQVSIAAHQTISEEKLAAISEKDLKIEIVTTNLYIDQNSKITSESTGNSPAAAIEIQANHTTLKNSSEISTSAQNTDGGTIAIVGNVVYLHDGLITTSVEGQTGDGGNITIAGSESNMATGRLNPDTFLVMNGGFIQANTAAADSKGGDINLALRGILVEKNSGPLDVDNPQRQIFQPGSGQNVIQAAAEAGTKGQINIGDAPELDISGDLIQMQTRLTEPATLAIDPCDLALAWETASSLVQGSRGGLPVWPGADSGVVSDRERLKKLLEETAH